MARVMWKPPPPNFARLENLIARYRADVCREQTGLDQRLRQGRMEKRSFCDLVENHAWIWFDAYGVLNRGCEPVAGAGETLRKLRQAGIPFCLVSNNATQSPEEIQATLGAIGIGVACEEIVTSGMVIRAFVAEKGLALLPYLWVGTPSSADCYAPNPQRFMVNHPQSVWDEDAAHYVLFSGNQDYHGGLQEKILLASEMRRGLPFLLANPDLVAPLPLGLSHTVAGFTACEVNADGRHPLMGIGKPFRPVFDLAWRRCGSPPWDQVLMVGDALETDILGGAALGVTTCLTLTGLYGPMRADLSQVCTRLGIRPDYVVESVAWEG